ncbi:hypothetical protein L3Y34_014884 [Caenorhabditis briggsae]|uniref:Uncharacterized protein n=1 Tax=Caenorhabditis briggsae TaxID=6238 RepID=A0AAE9DT46_CAEBR|nr:hypothetical protein L3Y34_014884 [Caenorhabditis briggsae]
MLISCENRQQNCMKSSITDQPYTSTLGVCGHRNVRTFADNRGNSSEFPEHAGRKALIPNFQQLIPERIIAVSLVSTATSGFNHPFVNSFVSSTILPAYASGTEPPAFIFLKRSEKLFRVILHKNESKS